ncbi:glycosyltransferase [Aquipuribacter sp. MA13-6]|uniref:glycosyltransferase n=1 Tax=unclassified Aquipuribacter TaxID=2635084 RepID=UPI003EE9E144
MTTLRPDFTHLAHLTDAGGLHEHADGDRPRPEHGYCVDDVARGLVVTCREPDPSPAVAGLRQGYLDFVLAAQATDGRSHNRRGPDLGWRDEPTVEDCWGRALWGLGAVVGAPERARVAPDDRSRALAGFDRAAGHRSPDARAAAFAGLGAAGVLAAHPDHPGARGLLADAATLVGTSRCERTLHRNAWAWPEPRLRYANAVVPEVLLAAGSLLERPGLVEQGLELLGWLLQVQTVDRHLSVVAVHGLGPGEAGPRFDQQPIEVAALADACALAAALDDDPRWSAGVRMAVAWFRGDNDSRTPMHDGHGGGYDGLERHGRNDNRGAESTLALLSVLQHGVRTAAAAGPGPRRARVHADAAVTA